MWQGSEGKKLDKQASIHSPCQVGWAGAENIEKKYFVTDGPTDRPTDRHGKFKSRVSATKKDQRINWHNTCIGEYCVEELMQSISPWDMTGLATSRPTTNRKPISQPPFRLVNLPMNQLTDPFQVANKFNLMFFSDSNIENIKIRIICFEPGEQKKKYLFFSYPR